MTDVFEHNPDDHEDPAPAATWLVGAVGALLLVATLLGLTALYYNVKAGEVKEMVLTPPYDTVETLRAEQEAQLWRPPQRVRRQDETGETVEVLVIPIDRAMEIVVAEHQP